MLSKKQAQIFFFGGTIISFALFLGLTWHTITQTVPDQTNKENLTEQVVHGKKIWERNNCMGCHTILGEGAYYAPELTKSYERIGPGMIKTILMSPVPWGPNGRKMVAYEMSEEDAEAVTAFLKWCGEIDLNGFPPEPVLNQDSSN
ncbi:MAG: cytochrome c [Bacteroidetes bacterium]|nr:cytochrome c [Bacteroidota bacterium]